MTVLLNIEIARSDEGLYLTLGAGLNVTSRRLDGVDEHQLGDALRQVDQLASPGANPGLCELALAGDLS